MAKTISDFLKALKELADDNTRYYGKWNSSTGNGKWNVPRGQESYPPTFDCGLAVTYAIYKAAGWKWNNGTNCAQYGYIWPNNDSSDNEWFLRSHCGATKYTYNKNILKPGDIILGYNHIWMYYGNNQIFEANDGYSSNKGKQIDIHSFIDYSDAYCIYRLPWEQGDSSPEPDMPGCQDLGICELGDKGPLVMTMQAILNGKNNAGLLVDGVFGEITKQALIDYQKKHPSLYVDGICGPDTWGDLLYRD